MAEVDVISKEATAGDNRIQLSSCAEYQTYTCNEQACWAMASFKAPFYEPTSRPSVDIVAVIDKSGSMRGVKLDLVKKTLLFVIDQCEYYHIFAYFTLIIRPSVFCYYLYYILILSVKECDRMSLVTYDTNVQLVFGLMKMDKANKQRSKSFVESIVDGSSTNLAGGLIKGNVAVSPTHKTGLYYLYVGLRR